ncbi:MAG: 6-phosphogluconolactonase, partial [Pedosphaera parvula]|nr:6-phosphogluconolactonase [Pedosphaera parvula]
MNHFDLIPCPGDHELAQAVAARLLDELLAPPADLHRPILALSGGRIAGKLFSALAGQSGRARSALGQTRFFWADERCVTPDDPDSNFGVAQKLLFKPLNIPHEQVYRLRGELPPAEAVAAAEAEARQWAPLNDQGTPVFDLILLGMGEDGHVASLFPGEPETVMDSPAIYRAVVAAKPPPHRITLGYGVIAAARKVWVLASGPGKEAALKESLAGEGRTPLARVLCARKQTLIFTDIKTS